MEKMFFLHIFQSLTMRLPTLAYGYTVAGNRSHNAMTVYSVSGALYLTPTVQRFFLLLQSVRLSMMGYGLGCRQGRTYYQWP